MKTVESGLPFTRGLSQDLLGTSTLHSPPLPCPAAFAFCAAQIDKLHGQMANGKQHVAAHRLSAPYKYLYAQCKHCAPVPVPVSVPLLPSTPALIINNISLSGSLCTSSLWVTPDPFTSLPFPVLATVPTVPQS